MQKSLMEFRINDAHAALCTPSLRPMFPTRDMGSSLHKQKCLRGGLNNPHETQRGKKYAKCSKFHFQRKTTFPLGHFQCHYLEANRYMPSCLSTAGVDAYLGSTGCSSPLQWQ